MFFSILMILLGIFVFFFALSAGLTFYLFKSKNTYFQEIFQSILNRSFEFHDGGNTENRAHSARNDEMSYNEALEILGLSKGADKKTVTKTYQRIMQGVHPDRGGSAYLARQLSQARDVAIKHARG